VIYAPGHSNSQTCFYHKEKKWMLAGDAILKITPTPIIEFSRTNPDIRENSLAIMLNTLEKLAAMDISKVFPGHYEPFDNHQKLIAFQLARIAMRKEETFKLIKEGKNRFFDLFDTLYTNRMNIPGMAMLRGYLDLLIEEKRIEAKTVDNFTAYVAIS
jgi:glyoxylase-like metal-dependent hydrolase (beta-lactamase superfamily II)